MRLLLDTNILIPPIEGRLSSRLREELLTPEAELHASVASLWEIAIKIRIGKLKLNAQLQRLPDLIDAMGLTLLTIKAAHVVAFPEPEQATRDPFDRLLLGQCVSEGLRLVTLDRVLARHPFAWQSA